VVFPVAGPVGLGAAEAVKVAGKAWVIGVDTDWAVWEPQYTEVILTSVLKNIDLAVVDTAKAVADGSFQGGNIIGTLKNGGVGIAPPSPAVPAGVTADLQQVARDLADGKIHIPGH
jgi:basic membrane protein A